MDVDARISGGSQPGTEADPPPAPAIAPQPLQPGTAFLHLPKTSGIALFKAFLDALTPAAVVHAQDTYLLGEFSGLDSLDEHLRQQIYGDTRKLPQADFVAGHFALSTVRAAYPAHRLVTVIREPRVRILSHWLFWRGNDATTMPGWGTWLDRVAMARQPLLAFLTNPVLASQVDNLLVRMLVWPHPLLPIGGFIPPDSDRPLLAAAARALAACDFVGLMEEPALDDRLSRWLGAAIHRRRENETQPLPADLRPDLGRELSEPTFAALDARTRLDRVLWAGELARVCPGRDADAAAARAWVMALLRYVAAAVVQPTGDAFPATPSFSQAAA